MDTGQIAIAQAGVPELGGSRSIKQASVDSLKMLRSEPA